MRENRLRRWPLDDVCCELAFERRELRRSRLVRGLGTALLLSFELELWPEPPDKRALLLSLELPEPPDSLPELFDEPLTRPPAPAPYRAARRARAWLS